QLRSGMLAVYDAERGTVKWMARPGQPYPPVVQNVASDDRYVIAVRDVRMFAYDRAGGHLEWMYELPTIPASPPASDGKRVFVSLGADKVTAFNLPVRQTTAVKRDEMISDAKAKPPTLSKEPEKIGTANVRKDAAPIMASNTAG